MSDVRTFQRSFNGGEVTSEMYGQIGDVKFQSGLALCQNFIVKPQGPVENRAGFAFTRAVKDSSKKTRIIPFTYSTTQTMIIEVGNLYLRFHTMGATLLPGTPAAWVTSTAYVIGDLRSNSGTNYYCLVDHTSGTFATDLAAGKWYALPATGEYEIPTPYLEADLFDLHYVQSADVLTIVHPNYAPRELRRLGATNWVLSVISFASAVDAPSGVTATASGHSAVKYTYSYVVTAVGADEVSESVASTAATAGGNLYETGGIVTIAWSAVTGATRYNVYKLQGGIYGFIGQTSGLSIVDDNITADLSFSPPTYETVFNGANDYPAAVSYHEQRRGFAGTLNKPNNIWMTRSGTESNMSYSLPLRDEDRISFRVAARESNTIRHIVPLSQLLLLTSAAEWRVTSINSDAITPNTFSVKPQSYVGASNVQPVIVNNNLIYGAARGGHIQECGYNWQANGFVTGDLSLRAAHLFDNYDIVDMAYSKAPTPIVWMISSVGILLGITYIPEQQVGAWHQHDTLNGLFESCATVAEGKEDVLYVVVKRYINSAWVRYIERLATRFFVDQEDAFFVDSGLTYDGASATVISGLGHLEGETVSILADGAVHPQKVVTSGSITLDVAASVVQVGLPIEANLKTLPAVMQIDGSFGQGRPKNVNHAWMQVSRSLGVFIGPDENNLVEVKHRTTEVYGMPPALKSEEVDVALFPSWTTSGQVYLRQSNPLPLTVVSLTLEMAIGG